MLELGKALNALIESATTTTIGNKVYPLDVPEKTSAPIIVYDFVSVPTYSNDGIANYDSTVDLYIIANSYSESIDIGKQVLNVFNMFHGIVEGITIVKCRLASIESSVQDKIFTSKLSFNIKNF